VCNDFETERSGRHFARPIQVIAAKQPRGARGFCQDRFGLGQEGCLGLSGGGFVEKGPGVKHSTDQVAAVSRHGLRSRTQTGEQMKATLSNLIQGAHKNGTSVTTFRITCEQGMKIKELEKRDHDAALRQLLLYLRGNR
jgi:hypothetical protein